MVYRAQDGKPITILTSIPEKNQGTVGRISKRIREYSLERVTAKHQNYEAGFLKSSGLSNRI